MTSGKRREGPCPRVDVGLLKRQASALGRVESKLRKSKGKADLRDAEHLYGVWNLLHDILDDLEAGKECVLR